MALGLLINTAGLWRVTIQRQTWKHTQTQQLKAQSTKLDWIFRGDAENEEGRSWMLGEGGEGQAAYT